MIPCQDSPQPSWARSTASPASLLQQTPPVPQHTHTQHKHTHTHQLLSVNTHSTSGLSINFSSLCDLGYMLVFVVFGPHRPPATNTPIHPTNTPNQRCSPPHNSLLTHNTTHTANTWQAAETHVKPTQLIRPCELCFHTTHPHAQHTATGCRCPRTLPKHNSKVGDCSSDSPLQNVSWHQG